VLGSWALRKTEVKGDWTKLENEHLQELIFLPNVIRTIKSRRRWAGHVARTGARCIQGIGGKTWKYSDHAKTQAYAGGY
jgi:hypothetical protein